MYYSKVITLATLYQRKYNTRQMFNKRSDIGQRRIQGQQAANMEINWNTFILSKLMGSLDESYLSKSYFGFTDVFEQYYQIMKSTGFTQMWNQTQQQTIEIETQVTEESEIVKKRCQRIVEEIKDDSSFDSDDSYYEETEEIGIMAMSIEERNNKKYSHIQNQKNFIKEQALLDFKKLALYNQI